MRAKEVIQKLSKYGLDCDLEQLYKYLQNACRNKELGFEVLPSTEYLELRKLLHELSSYDVPSRYTEVVDNKNAIGKTIRRIPFNAGIQILGVQYADFVTKNIGREFVFIDCKQGIPVRCCYVDGELQETTSVSTRGRGKELEIPSIPKKLDFPASTVIEIWGLATADCKPNDIIDNLSTATVYATEVHSDSAELPATFMDCYAMLGGFPLFPHRTQTIVEDMLSEQLPELTLALLNDRAFFEKARGKNCKFFIHKQVDSKLTDMRLTVKNGMLQPCLYFGNIQRYCTLSDIRDTEYIIGNRYKEVDTLK